MDKEVPLCIPLHGFDTVAFEENILSLPATPEEIQKYTNKLYLIFQHKRLQRMERMFMHEDPDALNRESYDFPVVHLLPENRVGITDLCENIGKRLLGKFFLCRTVVSTLSVICLETVIEEPKGTRALTFTLYNYFTEGRDIKTLNINQVLPIGIYMAVKNPMLRSNLLSLSNSRDKVEKGLVLRCDNPADIELISLKKMKVMFPSDISGDNVSYVDWHGSDEEVGARLKRIGNESFVDWRWTDALRWYNLALDYITEGDEYFNIICNKAATLVSFGCFKQGLECAEIVLEHDAANIKAIFRKTKALIGLVKYEEALSFINASVCNKDVKQDENVFKLKKIAQELFVQFQNGDILDSHLLSLARSNRFGTQVDTTPIPELLGPISVTQIENKGYGYVATQDIKIGQLVISCKSFANFPVLNENFIQVNRRYGIVGFQEVVTQIANKIYFDPELGQQVYQLWAGQEHGRLSLEDGDQLKRVDIKRIREIVKHNHYAFRDYGCPKDLDEPQNNGSGLWLMSSVLNHSCSEANVIYTTFNDLAIVRAVKEIKKGEELLLSYVDPYGDMKTRMNFLTTNYGFVCNCKLCTSQFTEDLSIIEEREKILKWFEKNCKNYSRTNIRLLNEGLSKLQRLVKMKEKTPLLNPWLINLDIVKMLMELYMTGRHQAFADWSLKILHVVNGIPGEWNSKEFLSKYLVRTQMGKVRLAQLEMGKEIRKQHFHARHGTHVDFDSLLQ